jgi:hypothetical protein
MWGRPVGILEKGKVQWRDGPEGNDERTMQVSLKGTVFTRNEINGLTDSVSSFVKICSLIR